MKKKIIIFVLMIVSLCTLAFGLTACGDGKSAYDLYRESYKQANGSENGVLSESEWLLSLKGDTGVQGAQGEQGEAGLSAYEIYKKYTKDEPVLTEEAWLESLKGDAGVQGAQGEQGEAGLSAYEIYKKYTKDEPVLTEEAWLESLKGDAGVQGAQGEQGEAGLSAYDIYCKYHPVYKGTEEEWINDFASGKIAESYNTTYNIIFTVATIPPVLASLECINNGYETYAFIERGKTYSGIQDIDKFHNIGFNVSSNSSSWFTQSQFDMVVNQIKELNVYGNEKFNIYLCDYSVFFGFGLAANASLNTDQYHLYMIEDGSATYAGLNNNYVSGMSVTEERDMPYERMTEYVQKVNEAVSIVTSKTNNTVQDLTNNYMTYSYAFASASIDNVTYLIQDDVRVKNYLESLGTENCRTKLLSAIGFEGYNEKVDFKLDLRFGSITDRVSKLNVIQKENYLKLMYGKYYDDTYKALTRTTLDDNTTPVPTKKLVFISSRVKSYPSFAEDFGYADVTTASQVPDSYAELSSMYKTDFLFGTEADYQLFINQLNLATNYNDNIIPEKAVLDAIRVNCFNYYLDYLVTLKFTYLKYGDEFDIILKGHPSEVLGEHGTWTQHYEAGGYRYDKLYDNLLIEFHKNDSIGKYIGLVPFGTAAENLAYLGADISLCGLPSSTYTGYDQSVDIKFIMARVNTAIDKDTNLNGRFADGTLLDHDKNGQEVVTSYYNIGNLYKQLIEYYSNGSTADAVNKSIYEEKFSSWLRSVNGLPENADVTEYDVDAQGFLIKPET